MNKPERNIISLQEGGEGMKPKYKWTEELDEMVTNLLYRLHFPCDRTVCNCDKVINKAKDYLEAEVFQDTYK